MSDMPQTNNMNLINIRSNKMCTKQFYNVRSKCIKYIAFPWFNALNIVLNPENLNFYDI